MIGKTILHYKILAKLGEGGMGVVYKARDTRLEREVAIKFLPRHIAGNADERQRFEIEAKAAAALNHPNIATIHAIEEVDGEMFIVMEYIDGQELGDLSNIPLNPPSKGDLSYSPFEGGRGDVLPIDTILNYATQIASGLQAAHAKGVSHRDIKSANIMVTESGQVKIMDFGLAKVAGTNVQLTKEHTTLGTAAYMSPEQTRGEQVDQRTDIWAFGVVLYEMLTGQLPFRGEYEQAVIYSILNEEPTPVSELREDVPEALQQITEKTLRKKTAERYQNCGEILADLKSIGSVESAAMSQTRAADSGAGTIRRSPLLYGGIAIFLVLAAITWFVMRQPATELATPTAADRNSIAVMYFENRSSEQDLDKILVDMLTTNLARHDALDVVSSQRLFDILKNMGKQDVGAINKTVATEVANKARVKTMLLGSIIQIGNRLRITSQLTNVETGDIIASEQAEGEKIEDIFGMVDELTEKISSKLIVAGKEPAEQPLRIADATTADYRAYQFYQRGLEYEWRFDFHNAAINFERAVEIDSTFAMAHLKIAHMRYPFGPFNHYADLAPARKRIALAEGHSRKTTPKEQLFISALKALFDRRMEKSISLFSDFVKQYPDEKEARHLLAILHSINNNLEQSLIEIQKAIELDPTYANAQNYLSYVLSAFGRHMEAIAASKRYIDLLPDVGYTYDSGWEIYMMADQLDNALAVCDYALSVDSNWQWFQSYAGYVYLFQGDGEQARGRLRLATDKNPQEDPLIMRNMAYFYLYEGRNAAALKELQRAVAAARAANDSSEVRYALSHFGKMLTVMQRFDEALKTFEQASSFSKNLYPAKVTPVDIITAYWTGVIHLRQGDKQKAQAQADKIRAMVAENKLDQLFLDYAYLLQAEIQLEKGDAKAAQEFVEQVGPFSTNSPRLAGMRARTLSHSGRTEEAVDELNKAKDNVLSRSILYNGGDEFDYFYLRSHAHYLLGRFYERDGDTRQAIAYYTKAIQQWQNADAGHEEFANAKARIAKLQDVDLP